MSSFESVNYSIRPNKNVERKLIFEALRLLDSEFAFKNYQYVGMGSMWFVDFLLAHKSLNINSLFSIEKSENEARAKFNKPYENIVVLGGDSSLVLPDLDWNTKSIAWMDYDSNIFEGPVLNDASFLIRNTLAGSVIVITVNAHYSQIPEIGDENDSKSTKRFEGFKDAMGDLAPHGLRPKALNQDNYPSTLAKVLMAVVNRAMISSGRKESLIPLFQYIYKDGAPMVTVGFMIVDKDDVGRLNGLNLEQELDHCRSSEPFYINVPNLTPKEKICLDQELPTLNSLTSKWMKKKFGFTLSDENLEAYQQFYKIYPVYSELLQ